MSKCMEEVNPCRLLNIIVTKMKNSPNNLRTKTQMVERQIKLNCLVRYESKSQWLLLRSRLQSILNREIKKLMPGPSLSLQTLLMGLMWSVAVC